MTRVTTTPSRLSTTAAKAVDAPVPVKADAPAQEPATADRYQASSHAEVPAPPSSSRHPQLAVRGKVSTVDMALQVEAGESPLRKMTGAQREQVVHALARKLAAPETGKPTRAATQERSAAATVLLDAARLSKGELREKALTAYVTAMAAEKVPGLKASLMVNLDAVGLALPAELKALADGVRAWVLPPAPPYAEWFKGKNPTLEVRHYVMEDFFRAAVSSYKQRGFSVEKQDGDRYVLTRTLTDPSGKNPPVAARVVLVKQDTDIFRDMADPKVHMVIYSGHSQLGGIVDASLKDAPAEMKGTKFVQLYQCRAKQTAGDVLTRYPGVHVLGTDSSAYDSDDNTVLDHVFEAVARRADYSEVRKDLAHESTLQPHRNYVWPDDDRALLARDDDHDGRKDVSALGTDRFFDPARTAERTGRHALHPLAKPPAPEALSGRKIEHSVAFANTAFFYFAEESRAAPLALKQTDAFIPAGWFAGGADEAVRIRDIKRGGKTFQEVSINSRYADSSREVIAGLVLMEMQKHLCEQDHGSFSRPDALRGLLLVNEYVEMMAEYSDDCDAVLKTVGEHYGLKGVSYELMRKAAAKDGDHGMGTPGALQVLQDAGVDAGLVVA